MPSPENYYDGTTGLKITVTNCNQYATQQDACMNNGNCGWCSSSNSCIAGNSAGPLAPCMRGNYTFTAPSSDWNPLNTNNYSMSRANVAGAQLSTFVRKD